MSAESQRRWRLEHPEYGPKQKLKASLKRFGLKDGWYEYALKQQDGRCAICRNPEPVKGSRFSIDHDHNTGKVRGLLCHNCNVGLGHFKDNLTLLEKAIAYLKNI